MEAVAYKPKRAFEGYKKNEIMGLTPVQLILKLYDYVIVNSKRRDLSKVNAGLTQLIAALDFEYKETSLGFFRLYRYCQSEARKGNFEEVENVIRELRSAWSEAFKLS
ncbi:MAG TPA: flagellar export chaperone FliS [Candidatus Acidoferrales bacterium]|nr:flagellar export chaperone FliS [Candidatus Acidoferrales bacterium]